MYTSEQIVTGAVGALLLFDNVWTKFQARKKINKQEVDQNLLSDAKAFEAKAEAMTKLAQDNLKLFQTEHEEHLKTRDYWHTKANKDQSDLANCQLKLAEANSRPDYSELAQFFNQHTAATNEILKGIEALLKATNKLLEVSQIVKHENA